MSITRYALWMSVATLVAVDSAIAQWIIESFEGSAYTPGANVHGLDSGTGFSGPWTEEGPAVEWDKIQEGSLTYPGLPAAGHSVRTAPPANYFTAPSRSITTINVPDGTSVWVSYLFRKDSDNTLGAPVAEDYFGLVLYGTGTDGALLIGEPGEAASFALGTAGSPSSGPEISSQAVTLNNTALLVARITFQSGPEAIQLFVNPDLSAGEPTVPSATKNNLDLGDFTTIGLLAGYNAVYSYDEIRVAGSFRELFGLPDQQTPQLHIAKKADGAVEITFEGVLETRSLVNSGPWTEASRSSPHVIPAGSAERARYFRARLGTE